MTEAQQRVLDALVELTTDGWPATVREVGKRAGLASHTTAFVHLQGLRLDGLAEQHPRSPARGWLPTSKGRMAVGEARLLKGVS